MLIEFSVGNYRSFKETVTFSMAAAKITSKNKSLDRNNIFAIDSHLSLLKSAAIYGANASGKSNLVHAINFMRMFVLNSSKATQVKEEIKVEGFRLSTEMEEKPSFFEIVFLLDWKIYRYGFEVNQMQVVSEWLFYVPTTREANLFMRKGNTFSISRNLKGVSRITDKTRDNALFLSVAAQFNAELAKRILLWFRAFNINSGIEESLLGYHSYTLECLERGENKDDILRLIKSLDLGIDDIRIEKYIESQQPQPNDFVEGLGDPFVRTIFSGSVKTLHKKIGSEDGQHSFEKFDLDSHESQGTKKLFALAGALVDTLKKGKVLLIDELDARLHPLMTLAIVNLFHSQETNPHNAQLIFTTHDTNLLSNKIFRRDQIWFTEKDKYGATHLYSLAEYKVRNDASFESDYIQGRYGAVPFIGDLSHLIE